MPSPSVRLALVGYGLWGEHHARAIAKTPGAVLAAIAERAAERRAAARVAYPAALVCEDYRDLVGREDVDAVDVVLPSHLHYEAGKAALEAGKHLLLEKPMVLSLEHADELVVIARQNARVLAVDHEMRLSRLWGKVKKLIDAGAVGIPQYVLIELSRFPYRLGSDGWRYDIERVGNWILEEPIHFFDLARCYLAGHGEPARVFARANSRQSGHPELQDNFTTIVDFSGGAYAVITQTLAAFEHHVTCKVSGTGGAIWAYWSGPDARTPRPAFGLRYGTADCVEHVAFDEVTGEVVELELQLAAFVRSIREGVPPPASGEDGRWSVRMCLAAQASVDQGRAVRIME